MEASASHAAVSMVIFSGVSLCRIYSRSTRSGSPTEHAAIASFGVHFIKSLGFSASHLMMSAFRTPRPTRSFTASSSPSFTSISIWRG